MSVSVVYHYVTKDIRRIEVDARYPPILRQDERVATIATAVYRALSSQEGLRGAVPQLAR